MDTHGRILSLDWLKAVFIVVVVLYHCPGIDFYIQATFPTFFAIAGYLFKPGRYSFGQFARRRCRQVLVPYLVFGALFYALWLAMALVHSSRTGEAVDWLMPLRQLASGYPTAIVGAYWFANCLLVMQLVYYAMMRWLPARWHLPLTMAVSAAVYYLYYTEFWALSYMLLYMPFYVFGVQHKDLLARVQLDTWQRRMVAIVAAGAAVWLMSHAMTHWHREVHNLLMLVLQFGVVTCVFALARWWTAVCRVHCIVRWVTFVSSSAIIFLAVQNDVIYYLSLTFDRVLQLPMTAATGIAIAALMMAIGTMTAWCIRRYLPFLNA